MAAKDKSTDKFPKVGDDEAQVVNVSGDPSPNTQAVRRPRTVSGTTPGGPTGHRTPVEINAETGQALGEMTERAAARAARRLALRETIDRVHPSEREMLRHLFGLNLPGR
jgi:hypothetical protein